MRRRASLYGDSLSTGREVRLRRCDFVSLLLQSAPRTLEAFRKQDLVAMVMLRRATASPSFQSKQVSWKASPLLMRARCLEEAVGVSAVLSHLGETRSVSLAGVRLLGKIKQMGLANNTSPLPLLPGIPTLRLSFPYACLIKLLPFGGNRAGATTQACPAP